jgi:hypothetical protein
MVELITTGIITVSSVVLFGYWLRCAWRLVRYQYPWAEDDQGYPKRGAGYSVRQGASSEQTDYFTVSGSRRAKP